jgi:hypothetical protein
MNLYQGMAGSGKTYAALKDLTEDNIIITQCRENKNRLINLINNKCRVFTVEKFIKTEFTSSNINKLIIDEAEQIDVMLIFKLCILNIDKIILT